MGKLVTGQLSLKNMSGPVTIANAAGESADRGFKPYIAFLAFISISIGVMNLLPIPVLDGGHFMYYIVELVRGKPGARINTDFRAENWLIFTRTHDGHRILQRY